MRGGAAGMRAAVNKNKNNKVKRSNRQADQMKRYGLVENTNKEAPDPNLLKNYADPKVEEPAAYRPSSASNQNGHYDHHAEIYEAEMEMER